MNICVCILYSVYSNGHTTQVRICCEPYANKFCAVDIFLKNQPSSSNIPRCQVSSHVRVWFHDIARDIDFYQPFRINYLSWNYNILSYHTHAYTQHSQVINKFDSKICCRKNPSIQLNVECPSDKWSNSFSFISWVTHGTR